MSTMASRLARRVAARDAWLARGGRRDFNKPRTPAATRTAAPRLVPPLHQPRARHLDQRDWYEILLPPRGYVHVPPHLFELGGERAWRCESEGTPP